MAASKDPAGGQPASNPLVDHLGSRKCWLVGSGLPKDPDKPNGDPLKAPCDERGHPVKAWESRADLLGTFAQTRRKLRPPAVRFVGVRSSAAGDVAFLDLDDVLNAGGGCVDAVAWHIYTRWPSFTYETPSGAGLRMVWIVEGDAQPVTVQTGRIKKGEQKGLSEVAFTAGVFNDKTGLVEPQLFNIGRELYYRADRFLIVTNKPYAWKPDDKIDPLRTITAGDLAEIAALVKAQHVPQADVIMPAVNADAAYEVQATHIGAVLTTTADTNVIVNIPQATPQPARVIEAQPMRVQDFHKEYAQAELKREAADIAATKEGGRNIELNRAAYQLGGLVKHGLLTDSEIERELADAAKKAGLSDKEAQATIKSGLNAGAAQPRQLPRPPQAQPAKGGAGVNMQSMRDRINTKRAVKVVQS